MGAESLPEPPQLQRFVFCKCRSHRTSRTATAENIRRHRSFCGLRCGDLVPRRCGRRPLVKALLNCRRNEIAHELSRDSAKDSRGIAPCSGALSGGGPAVIIAAVRQRETALARQRALVIGGSVGGLFAAHFLRSAGWEVAVFERASGDLGDRGTGIGTRPELFAAMRRAGIAADASLGIDVLGRTGLGPDGAVIHELAVPAVTSAWSRIWRPLRQALPDALYRGGKALTGVEQHAEGVTGIFADGGRLDADLLIAADGLHSTVRGAAFPGLAPRYAGYVAWRGVVEPHRACAGPARTHVQAHGVRLPGRRAPAVDPDAAAAGGSRRTLLPFRLVSSRRRNRAAGALHRCERPQPRTVDPATADPPRADRRHQARRRGAARAAACRAGERHGADHSSADLRS